MTRVAIHGNWRESSPRLGERPYVHNGRGGINQKEHLIVHGSALRSKFKQLSVVSPPVYFSYSWYI